MQNERTKTRNLIPNIKKNYIDSGIEMDFYLTQVFTGHGSFGRIPTQNWKKRKTVREQPSEHLIYQCPVYEYLRKYTRHKWGNTVVFQKVYYILQRNGLRSDSLWKFVNNMKILLQ